MSADHLRVWSLFFRPRPYRAVNVALRVSACRVRSLHVYCPALRTYPFVTSSGRSTETPASTVALRPRPQDPVSTETGTGTRNSQVYNDLDHGYSIQSTRIGTFVSLSC
ncbi:hypothetical protein L227DRAFT_306441 [Lentinus tigrinus ALCF2SS1-6]|uniref:Uncharacterized protein n=1 Tax=Lentinus tigrinus ALCF2SS1-6 TaxID=1328759 RepID=A0A5C2RW38_9APHY|nr:hypothetical protein L227DRAFT_306441 [Lentinus tigrinus ALCF2SS1-6]